MDDGVHAAPEHLSALRPNPLTIDIVTGNVLPARILTDLMGLTKLNFNNAGFSDGLPVTLRFADLTGEILTAGPVDFAAPLPFRNYKPKFCKQFMIFVTRRTLEIR